MDEGNEPLVIVLQHQGRQLSDRRKSLVKSHVARRVHRRRLQPTNTDKVPSIHPRDKRGRREATKEKPYTVRKFDDWRSPLRGSTIPDRSPGTSPRSLLSKGNADPFATTVKIVDPIVNQLITFYRESHVPLQHWRKVDGARRSSYATTFFQHIVNALQDSCTGYAYLSGYAAMIANITQDTVMATTPLDFRSRAYAKLHGRLANSWADAPTSLPWTLYSFFTSAINSHDFGAAGIHGRALRGILQPGDKTRFASFDHRLLHSLLWQDIQRSALTLTRPLFDLRWMTMNLVAGPFFNFVWRNMLQVRSTQSKITASVDESVARVFSETSYLLRLTDSHTVGHIQLAKSALRKIAARSLILEGQLLNHYIDRRVPLSSGASSMPSTHREICVILAGIYWLRRAGHHEGFRVNSLTPQPRRNVYDDGSKIRKHIKHAMSEAGAEELSSDPTLLLWILYVGNVIEEGLDLRVDVDNTWFSRIFVEQAKRMGLLHWSAVEAVLEEVLYRPEMSPYARWTFDWFAGAAPGVALPLMTRADYVNVEAFSYPHEKEDAGQSPGGSVYSSSSVLEEDRISVELHDSVYGLFD